MPISRRKYQLLVAIAVFSFLSGAVLLLARFYPAPEPEYGVSFSLKYAEELGVNPKDTLNAVTGELGFKHLRLMSYWDLHEPEKGKYDFSDLDWQFELAEKNDVTVLLAIGQRQPRWPECHIPNWAAELAEASYQEALLGYLKTVVERYRNHAALGGYHLENEAANRSFGHCPPFDHSLFTKEFDLVKSLDQRNPVTLSVSSQYGIPIRPPVADHYAMSIYRQAHFELFGRQIYWNYAFVPAEWHRLRAWAMNIVHSRSTYIHELQTEPWGSHATVRLSPQEQDKYMSPGKLKGNVEYARIIGTPHIYLWGGEWWFWRREVFNDHGHWEVVRDIVNSD